MVDLPIPQPGVTTLDIPHDPRPGIAGQGDAALAAGMSKFGAGLDDLNERLGEEAGQEAAAKVAVTRDDQGNPVVTTPETNIILGKGGDAYHHAVMVGTLAKLRSSVDGDINDLRLANQGDVNAFDVAAANYRQRFAAANPGAAGAMAVQYADRLIGQTRMGLVNSKADNDIAAAHNALIDRLGVVEGQMDSLAQQGLTSGAQWDELQHERNAIQEARVGNPRFPYNADQRSTDDATFNRQLTASGINAAVDKVYKDQGGIAAQKYVHESVADPKLALSVEEQNAIIARANARIAYNDGQTETLARANQNVLSNVQEQVYKHQPVASDVIEEGLAEAKASSRPDLVHQWEALKQQNDFMAGAARGLTAQQMRAAQLPPGGMVASIDSYLDRVRQIENPGGNPAAVSPTGATGDFQFTKATAAAYGLTDRTDPVASREAARRLTLDNANQLGAALGRPASFGELYLAHQQGAAGAAKLLLNPNARAGDLVGDKAIRVNGGDPDAPASVFTQKWAAKFDGGPSVNGRPYTPEQAAQNPYLFSTWVKTLAGDQQYRSKLATDMMSSMTMALGNGVMPSPAAMAQVQQIVATSGDATLQRSYGELRASVAGSAAGRAASMATPAQGQAILDEADRQAAGGDLTQAYFAKSMRASMAAAQKEQTDNPMRFAQNMGWIAQAAPPLDASDAQGFNAGVQARRWVAGRISAGSGDPAEGYVFSKDDKDGLISDMAGADSQKAAATLRNLSATLDPREIAALTSDKDVSGAIAGMAKSGDITKMGAAFDFMRQQYEQNPMLFEGKYGASTVAQMKVFEDKTQFMAPDDAKAFVMKSQDPSAQRARDVLGTAAEDATKNLTPKDVAGKFGSWLSTPGQPVTDSTSGSSAEMLGDYREAYRDAFVESGGDKQIATDHAVEQIGKKWGVSAVNGGRLMAYPPERFYPPDANGSQAYIGQQLRADIEKFAKAQGVEIGPVPPSQVPIGTPVPAAMPTTPEEQRAFNIMHGNYALVADQQTRDDLRAGRAPSYRVIVSDMNGQMHALEQKPGAPFRFFADREAVVKQQFAGFAAAEADRAAHEAAIRDRAIRSFDMKPF